MKKRKDAANVKKNLEKVFKVNSLSEICEISFVRRF